jgi:hypothetical protein
MLRATNREQVRQIRVLVSSPNDIKAERDLLEGVVEDINRNIAEPGSFVLQLFKGEQRRPNATGVIDSQLSDCDIYLGFCGHIRHTYG